MRKMTEKRRKEQCFREPGDKIDNLTRVTRFPKKSDIIWLFII